MKPKNSPGRAPGEKNAVSRWALAMAAGGTVLFTGTAFAQAVSAIEQEEVVVTATKRGLENVQDVPIAVTAFGAETLEALNFHDLTSLSYTVPNVQLEDVGTAAGIANFSIRGLGINSSIPSIDPTVGVFIDGVYMGINGGILFDSFDIEAVEVLRGPQGVLFGRNVTGGAVLVRTSTPGDDVVASARVAIETGPNFTMQGVLAGPLIEGVLSGKLAMYRNEDTGWFTNLFDNSQHGQSDQFIFRPAFVFTPFENLEFILRLEAGEVSGDGPPGQNHALFSRDSFDFAINEPGYYDNSWRQAFLETNLDVPFGAGRITNIFGWRQYDSESASDIDATPVFGFHARAMSAQEQWSNELRYAGTFGNFDVTTGVYYFTQDLLYIENRRLAGGLVNTTGGGEGTFSTTGVFLAIDWHLTDTFTINGGIRYTQEEKEADISVVRAGGGNVDAGTLVNNFPDNSAEWEDTSPRIGFQWTPTQETQIYGFWAQGFRSGGFNFRNTDPGVAPNFFDAEQQSSFELGLKHDFAEGRARINLAVFHNTIEDIQREINTPGALGVTQVITNVGEAEIVGFEAEGRLFLTDSLFVTVMAGYVDGKYNEVNFDLNSDGVVTAADLDLELPRLAPWTYGASVVWDLNLGDWAVLSSRVTFNHRDENFYTDNNRGFLNAVDDLSANFTLTPTNSPVRFSLYGNNLLDEPSYGGDTQLPDGSPLFGGDGPGPLPPPTFSPLNKGRVIGFSMSVAL